MRPVTGMGERKKILMVTAQLGYGGAETSFIRLANFLSGSADVTVALFTKDYGTGAYAKGHEALNATIVLLDGAAPCGRLRRWAKRIVTLRKLKQQHDATISFLSGPNLVNVLAGVNTRSIVSVRGSRVYDPVSGARQQWLFRYVLDPIIYRLAARIVPVSAGLRNEIGDWAKIHAIPPFIELPTIQQKLSEPVAAPYTALKGQPVIIAVGRLSLEKGFHHLIRVFATLATRQPGVKLLLVGDGPMLGQLRAQCTSHALVMDDVTPGISAVLFAGYQKNVLPLMAQSRVFALTSATEGFPNVVLEAMLAGVPVIAADTPWGARAILGADTQVKQPYPTTQPTAAPYGMLMPRIDTAESEAAWLETLDRYTREAQPVPQGAAQRPADFDITIIGAQWTHLIEGMIAQPSGVRGE